MEKQNADLGTEAASKTIADLIYVANADGSDVKLKGNTAGLAISSCLANADASIGGLEPASIVIEEKVTLSGNNSGFNDERTSVTIGNENVVGDVTFMENNAIFPVDTIVEVGSSATFNTPNDVTLKNDLTVKSNKKVLKADENVVLEGESGTLVMNKKLILDGGAVLTLGSNGISKVNADVTNKYPQVMTWPEGTFDNTMTTSDGTDGFTSGAVHDSVFSYTTSGTAGTDLKYHRTHDAFLSKSVSSGSETVHSYFEIMDTDVILDICVYGRTDSYFGKMGTNIYTKPASGLLLDYYEATGVIVC